MRENPAYDTIRSINGKKKLRITLELIFSLPIQFILDIYRCVNILFIRLSKNNILFVASNHNQTKNIKNLPETIDNFDLIISKGSIFIHSFFYSL